MNILVRAPNWIGDQVLAYPFYTYLRRGFPKAKITVACVSWVKSIQFRDLVDEVITLPVQKGLGTWEKFLQLESSIDLFKGRSWDLGFSLPNSFSAAWLLWRSKVRRRRGYRVDARGFLLNEGLPWNPDPRRHRAQAYVDLLPEDVRTKEGPKEIDVTSFWKSPDTNSREQKLVFRFEESWDEKDLLDPPSSDYWVMAPGSQAESRRWPTEYYARLAERVIEETGWDVVIVGSGSETDIAHRLKERLGEKARDFTARGSVSSLASIFRHAKFSVTNESGLAHVAALCGSPTHIVCGAADPRRTQPLGPGRVQVSVNSIECWPCERNFCLQPSERKIQCLKGIEPHSVWEEIRSGFSL